jgi:P pilus assembly chaperone PapD
VELLALGLLLAAAPLTPSHAQLRTAPRPAGIDREEVVAAPPGGSAVIYTVGLRGQSNPTKLSRIDIRLSPLAAPLTAGLTQADFVQLRLIESTDQNLGDADDVLLNTVPAGAINLAGGITAVSDGGNATMLSSQYAQGFRFRMYYIVADLAATATTGHAFRLGADNNHITTSTPATIGNNITARNRNRVVVNDLVPVISVVPATLAFGNVLVNASSSLPLTVSNLGAADLVVTSVTSSNGRFVRDIGSFTLPPGGSQTINVTFRPTTPGAQTGNLTLTHNAPAAGTTTIVPMTGTGLAPTIGVAPSSLLFGNVLLSTPRVLTLTVSNTGTSTLNVTNITSSNGQFVPNATAFTVAPGNSQAVNVTFTPTALGNRSGTLSIVHNDLLAGSPTTVSMSGTGINPVVTVAPTSLAFGTVQAGSSSILSLTVSNTGTSDLVVSSVTSSNPRFSPDLTSFTVVPGANRVVSVTFAPIAGGAQAGTLTLTHNAVGGTTAVSLTGTGASPAISLSPASLAFGNVVVGGSSSLSLTVSNPGTATLTVTNITASDGQYVPALTSFSVAPGGSQAVNVTFTPVATGSQPATLSITHNAAGSPTSAALSGTGTSASIGVSPLALVFGSVVLGSSSSLSLVITNTGGAPLSVTNITSSDGQFAPDATSFTISAGGSQTVNVTFTPATGGSFAGTLSIAHGATGSPATVPLSGTGTTPQIAVSPSTLTFGSVVVGSPAALLLTVTNPGDADLNVTATSSDDGQFTASPTGYIVAPGASRAVTVTFTPTATGAQAATLSLTHNAAGSPTTVALAGTGTAPSFSATPGSLDFGSAAIGASASLTATVANAGTATLNVTSVTSGNGQFVPDIAAFTVAPGGSQEVHLTFTPNAAGVQTSVLTFVHNAAGSPSTVAMSGSGTSPGFGLSPTSLDFGGVPLGSSGALALTITNPGNGPLNVSNITSSSGPFAPDLTAFTIAAGGSQTVNLTFTPEAIGLQSGTLTITHNASGSPRLISMTGTGTNPGIYVSPDSLGFGNVVYGQPRVLLLTVWSVGGSTLTVSDIAASDAEFTALPAAFTLAPGATQTVTVTFAASTMGSRSGVLFISHDAAGGFTGVPVTASATVGTNQTSLDFGVIGAEADNTIPVTINNPSLAPVTIVSVVSDNPVFVPDLTTFVIPAGGSQVIQVTFAPPKPGLYTGNLRVTHNPTVVIPLSGSAPGSTEARAPDSSKRRHLEVPFGGELLMVLSLGLYGLFRRSRGRSDRRAP